MRLTKLQLSFLHIFFRQLFLGLLTTASYKKKKYSTIVGEVIASNTNNEFNILLTARKVFIKKVSQSIVKSTRKPTTTSETNI